MLLPNQEAQNYKWDKFLKRGYYIWCKEHSKEWKSKRIRPILAEIVNKTGPAKRQRESKTYGGCVAYNAYLCKKGDCFRDYHSHKNTK
jgi:hypothetical protein